MQNFITLQDLTKVYTRGEVPLQVLHGITCTIAKGEYVALMGSSGSGKSTLMNILGCLDTLTTGTYTLEGRNVTELSPDERALIRNSKIGFVFQNFNLLARTTALNNVVMPVSYAPTPVPFEEAVSFAKDLLKRVGLEDRMDHHPSQLSGGQQQRVAIARALINKPMIVLADEPTGNLDSQTTEEVLQMFDALNRNEGITIILVTHEADVARHAHRIIRLKDGRINSDVRQTGSA